MEEREMSKGKDSKVHLRNIIDNYKNLEADIVEQLIFEWNPHGTTIGSNRENVWKELFERIVPKKFQVESNVFIIDSGGNRSSEVDLAIFDEQYTPYIFKHGVLKFIPIEAVAAVIECKSEKKSEDVFQEWVKNVDSLRTSQDSIVRIAGKIAFGSQVIDKVDGGYLNTQTASRPIKILCYISSTKSARNRPKGGFDIVLEANKNQEEIDIIFSDQFMSLYEWYLTLNHTENARGTIEKLINDYQQCKETYKDKPIAGIAKLKDNSLTDFEVKGKKGDKQNNLLSFIFQFNQLLMLINNPVFFPHLAYVKMFSEYLENKVEK